MPGSPSELLDAVVADPRGAAVVVEGRRGLGKTTLLSVLADQAWRRDWTVCQAGAGGRDPHPYGPLVEALEDELTARPDAVDRLDAAARTLAGVFPALRAEATPYRLPEPYDVGQALRRVLSALAVDRPLVLLVDDLHAADAATAEVVRAQLRNPPRGPVLVVATQRPRAAVPGPPAGLEIERADGRSTRWELTELSAAEQVAPDGVCAAHRARLGSAAGNPRLLALLWSTCTGTAECSGRPWWELSELVSTAPAQVLLAEFGALAEPARSVARAAAVSGPDFDLDLARDILGRSREEVLAGVDQLIDVDVLAPGDIASRFRFRHPALRAAAYWSAPTGWRMAAHATAVATLRGRGAPVQSYARHVQRADGDARWATAVLGSAGRAVEQADVGQAIEWYDTAVRMLRGTAAADRQRAALLVALARGQVAAGRYDEARAHLDEREGLLAGMVADSREQADAAAVRVELAWLAGDLREARDRLHRATARAHGAQDELARLHNMLAATAAWEGGAVDGDLRWCDEALLSAVGTAGPVLTAHALAAAAVVRLGRGSVAAAAQCADEAARLVGRHTAEELAAMPLTLAWLGWAEVTLEEDVRAAAHLDRAVTLARASGHRSVLVAATAGLALLADRQGRPDRAAALLDGLTELAPGTGSPFLTAVVRVARAQVAVGTGDTARAYALTDPAVLAPVADSGWGRRGRVARAAALLADGDPAGCLDLVLAAGGGDELPDLPAGERVAAFGLLVRAAAALERWDTAGLHAKRAHRLAEDLGLSGQLATARLALVEGGEDGGQALRLLGQAGRDALAAGHLGVAARATVLAARAHAAHGDLRAAEAEVRSGAAVVGRLGSPQLAAAVRAGWATVAAPPDPDVDALGTLSPRETEIADLVALGLTNQQIGRKLTVSPKTVETHLGRIFGKLGVSSRAEIANLVGRADGALPQHVGRGRSCGLPRGPGAGPAQLGAHPEPIRQRRP